MDVQSVGSAVQCVSRLAAARLPRHRPDRPRRHVGCIGDEHVDATAQRARQGVEQIAVEHPVGRQVQAGTRGGDGIDVGRVDLTVLDGGGERGTDGTAPATHVDDHGTGPREFDRAVHQILGAATGDEHPFSHRDAPAVEEDLSQYVFEGFAADPPRDEPLQIRGCGSGFDEQLRLLLGEHAPGCSQCGDDVGVGPGGGDHAAPYRARSGRIFSFSGEGGSSHPAEGWTLPIVGTPGAVTRSAVRTNDFEQEPAQGSRVRHRDRRITAGLVVAFEFDHAPVGVHARRRDLHPHPPFVLRVDRARDETAADEMVDGPAHGLVGHPACARHLPLRQRGVGHRVQCDHPRVGEPSPSQGLLPGLLDEPGRGGQQTSGGPLVEVVSTPIVQHAE